MISPTFNGKHKVPRYIYHLTNQKNYESIVHDGVIKRSTDNFCGDGVFTIELMNFFKRWGKNKAWNNSNLQYDLVQQAKKIFSQGLVLLRIPTDNLDINKLKIRSQNRLFGWINSHEKEMNKISGSSAGIIKAKLLTLLYNTTDSDNIVHLMHGTSASNSSLFDKRKEAIEYIYQEDIPVDIVEKIGEIDNSTLRNILWSKSSNQIKEIFSVLLQGKNEIRGIDLIK